MFTVEFFSHYGQVLDEFKEHNGISGGVQTLYNFASKVSAYLLIFEYTFGRINAFIYVHNLN